MNNVLENVSGNLIPNVLRCISALAGFIHDLGKATTTFQSKLIDDSAIGLDVMRHERLSCVILSSLYAEMFEQGMLNNGDDSEFFTSLANLSILEIKTLFQSAMKSEKLIELYGYSESTPIADLSKSLWHNDDDTNVIIFNALYFLVLTHHKLPELATSEVSEKGYIQLKNIKNTISFVGNNPFENDKWLTEFQYQCKQICEYDFKQIYTNIDAFTSAVLYFARPSLVIADQYVSSHATEKAKENQVLQESGVVYANSYTNNLNERHMAQPLIEHLFEVSNKTTEVFDFTINGVLETKLPTLDLSPKELTDKTNHSAFSWQDMAINTIDKLPESGNLILVSSETGSGKTRANAKIASKLRNHRQLRLTTLLGMNTLTKQTAKEYINDIGLNHHACAITGHAITNYEIEKSIKSTSGCENLIIDEFELEGSKTNVEFILPDEALCTFNEKYNQIMATPFVVATIDHLIESVQSGRSTPSRLLQRLQTSDLVIDEIDSYSAKSLVPIYKLVYLCGLFHRNLIISSATLRPDVAKDVALIFDKGIQHHNVLFNTAYKLSGAVISNLEHSSFTANSIDEFNQIIETQQIKVRRELLKKAVKRRLDYVDIHNAQDAFNYAKQLHQAFSIDINEFKFSAGAIRLNNVKYVNAFARSLAKLKDIDTEIAVVCYHARLPTPVRYRIEQCLDNILKRKDPQTFESMLLSEPEFKQTLNKAKERNVKNIMLIVVCSPIEETGRDHDFDYGITEPCSNHSLIQFSGRIRRHRDAIDLTFPNILMFNQSLKQQYEPDYKPYLSKPGAESKELRLQDETAINEAFIQQGIDYQQRIDASVCLIDYPENYQKITNKQFSNLNEIEVQQVLNVHFDIFTFIDDAYERLSKTHALKFPLREQKKNEVPIWYDGAKWLMPAVYGEAHKHCKTEQCNWLYLQESMPNLWFNQDIDSILTELTQDQSLHQLLCSQLSPFMITKTTCEKMRQHHFCCALGLVNLQDKAIKGI